MNIAKDTEQTLAFLLVDKENFDQPVLSSDVTVKIAKSGQNIETIERVAVGAGEGWYHVNLTAEDTNTAGPLIFVASAPGSVEWRDIHYVVGASDSEGTPPSGGSGGATGGGSTSTDIGPNLVRDGNFTGAGGGWIFYTNGRGAFSMTGNTARVTIQQLGNNMQLYQAQIALRQAKHRLSFEVKCNTARQMQVVLHQHELPRRNLGVLETVQVTNQWQRVNLTFTSPINETNARLRFWFVTNTQPGDIFEIKDVQLFEQSA